MHRVCRLVTHESIRGSGPPLPGSFFPDLGQEPLMKSLLAEVVTRAKVQLGQGQSPCGPPSTQDEIISIPKILPRSQMYGVVTNGVSQAAEVHESTAALALYSCGVIGMPIARETLEILSKVILAARSEWSIGRIVMVTLALGKANVVPLQGDLHAALVEDAYARLLEFSPEEISTLLWGLAHARYDPGSDFITAAMAELYLKVDRIPQVGIFSTMDALSLLEWVPPAPQRAKAALRGPMPWAGGAAETTPRYQQQQQQQYEGSNSSFNRSMYGSSSSRDSQFYSPGNDSNNNDSNQFRVRDLRELQNMARAWEQERRRGLAAFLNEQQSEGEGGDGGGGGGGKRGTSWEADHGLPYGGGSGSGISISGGSSTSSSSLSSSSLGEFSLEALAQKAIQLRMERDKVARLSQEASRIARELRNAAAVAASMNESSNGGAGFAAEDGFKRKKYIPKGLKPAELTSLEDEEVLVAKFLTGTWPSDAPTATAGAAVLQFNEDPSSGKNEASPSTLQNEFISSSSSSDFLPAYDTASLPLQHKTGDKLETALGVFSSTSGDSKNIKNEGAGASVSVSSLGRGYGRRIFRLGPLLAEASVHPSSGRVLIEPHYDPEHLWNPDLLYPSQAQHALDELERHLELEMEGHGSGALGGTAGSTAGSTVESVVGCLDPGVEDFNPDFSSELELSSLEELSMASSSSTSTGFSSGTATLRDDLLLEEKKAGPISDVDDESTSSHRGSGTTNIGTAITSTVEESDPILSSTTTIGDISDMSSSEPLSSILEDSSSLSSSSSSSLEYSRNLKLKEAAAAAMEGLAARSTAMLPSIRLDQAVSLTRYFGSLRHVDLTLLTEVRNKFEKAVEDARAGLLPASASEGYRFLSTNNNTAAAAAGENTQNFSRRMASSPSRVSTPGGQRIPLTSISIADLLWSFASLAAVDLMPRDLSRKLMEDALSDQDFSPVALARCCWSLAVLGHLDAAMLRTVCAQINTVLEHKGQDLEALAGVGYRWELARNPSKRNLVGSSTSTSTNNSTTSHQGDLAEDPSALDIFGSGHMIMLKQLFQAALQVEIATGEPYHTLLPPSLRDPAAAAWQDRRNFLYTSSLQRHVASALRSLGLHCELEHCPRGSYVVIDVAVFDPETGAKLAVEVDGPSHYATNLPSHELGAVRLRDSLLRHSGWEVVSVPYYEWVRVQPWERAAYVRYKVAGALRAQGWRGG